MSDFIDAEDERRRYRALQLAVQWCLDTLTKDEMIDVADDFVDYMKNGSGL